MIDKTVSVDARRGFNAIADKLFNPMDYSLIMCTDLNLLLTKLKYKRISINQGPNNRRALVNRMINYLCMLDVDMRNAMFYHHRYHYYNNYLLKDVDMIPRDRFSFDNIHKDIYGDFSG